MYEGLSDSLDDFLDRIHGLLGPNPLVDVVGFGYENGVLTISAEYAKVGFMVFWHMGFLRHGGGPFPTEWEIPGKGATGKSGNPKEAVEAIVREIEATW